MKNNKIHRARLRIDKISLPIFIALTTLCTSCTQHIYLKKINAYLNASTVEEKSKYMAENYHNFFLEKKGAGNNKSEALQSFMKWDGPMHPDIKISNYTKHDKVWVVNFNEQNDFTKLIGFPGWKGTMTITFDDTGLIEETFYVPDSTNLSYKPYLAPALDWLRKNKPAELNEVYRDNKLIQTEAAANKWRELLKNWRDETNPKSN